MYQSASAASVRHGDTSKGGLGAIEHMDRNRLGILLFIMSEALFFFALIITYIVYHNQGVGGPTAKTALDVKTTGIFSLFLFSSSITMGRATARIGRNDAAGVRRWLGATILLGAIFLVGQGSEYVRLYQSNVTIDRNLWSSTFFTLTGFHGLHVLIGLISMTVVAALVSPGKREVQGASAAECVALYWHFVDAVWVVIFSLVYLWPLLS